MGTWALPETRHDFEMVNQKLKELSRLRSDLYNLVGDDELFDSIHDVRKRIVELRDSAAKRVDFKVNKVYHCPEPNCGFAHDNNIEIYSHMILIHGVDKKMAHIISSRLMGKDA